MDRLRNQWNKRVCGKWQLGFSHWMDRHHTLDVFLVESINIFINLECVPILIEAPCLDWSGKDQVLRGRGWQRLSRDFGKKKSLLADRMNRPAIVAIMFSGGVRAVLRLHCEKWGGSLFGLAQLHVNFLWRYCSRTRHAGRMVELFENCEWERTHSNHRTYNIGQTNEIFIYASGFLYEAVVASTLQSGHSCRGIKYRHSPELCEFCYRRQWLLTLGGPLPCREQFGTHVWLLCH